MKALTFELHFLHLSFTFSSSLFTWLDKLQTTTRSLKRPAFDSRIDMMLCIIRISSE